MKIGRRETPSATSLEAAPGDDETARMKQYVITMSIRLICLILAVVIQPFGWYTFVFAAGFIFLPWVAVMFANQIGRSGGAHAISPDRALEAPAPEPEASEDDVTVIQITETTKDDPQA
ncbi:MAG TPA: DUF3099 domain-containing protein [Microbacterium sp.]|nr:DUF3099 domain-containing protein [Microbacterium sp.]